MVIAIIAILVALLLPAVQSAREAARIVQCKNHLRQFGIGILAHHEAHRHLPAGGWSQRWAGDPDEGFGKGQPGGWEYNILPFIEEAALHDMGAGATVQDKKRLARDRLQISVAMFYCPSRRGPGVRPLQNWFFNASPMQGNVKIDYAANGGTVRLALNSGPSTIAGAKNYPWPDEDRFNGIVHIRSTVKLRQISDGTTKTLLLGEKYLRPEFYEDSQDLGDAMIGLNYDSVRWTSETPKRDTRGLTRHSSFGGPHVAGWNATLCDGSVRTIGYQAEAIALQRLGIRHDSHTLDMSSF